MHIKNPFKKKKKKMVEEKLIRSLDLGNGLYSVDGVKIEASSHAEAVNKWREKYGNN